MAATTIRFFSPGTELGVLEERLLELKASAHAPPLKRAEQVLEDVRAPVVQSTDPAAGFFGRAGAPPIFASSCFFEPGHDIAPGSVQNSMSLSGRQ